MGSAVTDLARLLRESFGVWAAYRGARKRARRLAKRMFGGVVLRYCRGAWHRWRFGSDPFEADDGDISKGGRLLGLAARRRTEALDEAREALLDLQQVRQSCDALAYNRQQMQNWKAKNKAGFEVAELSMPAGIPFAREDPQGDGDSNAAEHSVSKVPASTAHLLQGDGLYRMGRADDAVKCYAAAVDALWQRPRLEAERRRSQGESAFESGPVDVVELARLYSRTGAAQAAALHHAESVVRGAAPGGGAAKDDGRARGERAESRRGLSRCRGGDCWRTQGASAAPRANSGSLHLADAS
ncbi:hypothetical protein M885DRAFT_129977 [Pelagophyceae sp. CCMP2097]|nr:hypothetical protein M885DRAFT_129977 [Pelagophyceae sp. CCMP2097]